VCADGRIANCSRATCFDLGALRKWVKILRVSGRPTEAYEQLTADANFQLVGGYRCLKQSIRSMGLGAMMLTMILHQSLSDDDDITPDATWKAE
jgi:hypothetical protein